jgi:hypothetical protein
MATEFLNVDLEVFSREDLAVFARALGRSVHPLHVGPWGSKHAACIELWVSGYGQSADSIIQRMVRLISRLPIPARRLWNHASVRRFNIGVQADSELSVFELPLAAGTIQAVARVGASVIVTVYAAESKPARGRQSKGRTSRRTRG